MNTSKLRALHGLDRDIRQSLLNQLRDLWTHTSTALEGNTLTLGETKFVIDILASYEQATGQLTAATGVWPSHAPDAAFRAFCQRSYRATHALIEQAKTRQAERAI